MINQWEAYGILIAVWLVGGTLWFLWDLVRGK